MKNQLYNKEKDELLLIIGLVEDYICKAKVLICVEDFTYKNPYMIFNNMRKAKMPSKMKMNKSTPDLNDIDYDTYLTNKRSLADPDIVTVTPGKNIRLRIINGSSSTNYQIDLGKFKGTLIAIDRDVGVLEKARENLKE